MFGIGSSKKQNSEQNNLLYDSKVCRLCGDENDNGRPLFRTSEPMQECETSKLINQYLPVVVEDDGISPRWICPGCHIQLESTAQFFEMILKGQQLISTMLLQEKQAREAQQKNALKETHVDDIGPLYDTLDQAKWNELFGKPNMEITMDRDNVLIPLELFELDDLLEQEDNLAQQQQCTQELAQLEPELNHNNQQTLADKTTDERCNGIEQDWIVNSEVTKVNGRLIGFIHNHDKTDIGSLVVLDSETGRKRTHAKFVCDICSKIFAQELRYIKHRKTHNILFECSVCLLKFGSSVKLTIHQKETQHQGKGIVEGLKLTSVSPARRADTESTVAAKEEHIEQSDPSKRDAYACDNCEDTFPELSIVLKHEESVHAGANRSFVCCDCGKSFQGKNMLKRHRDTHTEERPHQCTVCEAAFKTRSTLSKHSRTHTDGKRYHCTMCSQQFAYKTSLDLHLNWHNGVKPFECEYCAKRFSQRGNLKEHLRVHSGDKPFSCGVCAVTFATSSQHRTHVRRHMNERPFECELCSKTFLQRENYKNHMRRHRNEKPYACEQCGRAFTERWALRKHIRTHTHEKPYSCKHCGKQFSDSSNHIRHVATIHGKEPKMEHQMPADVSYFTMADSSSTVAVLDGPVDSIGGTETLVALSEAEILSLDPTDVYLDDE